MIFKLALGLLALLLSVSVGTFGLWGLFKTPHLKNPSASLIGIIFFMLVAGAIGFLFSCVSLVPYLTKGHSGYIGNYQSLVTIFVVNFLGVWIGKKSWSWMTKKP